MAVDKMVPPVLGSVTAVQEEYNDNPYAIKVTVSNITDENEGDGISSFSFYVDGGDPIVVAFEDVIDNGNGSYSYYIELEPEDAGEHTISATVTDLYDKTSEIVSAPALVLDDVTPPDMVDLGMGLEDQKLVVSQVGQTVTFTWDEPYDNVGVVGYNVWFDGNNGTAFTVYTNTCSTSDLAVGEWHAITIEAFDAAGNVGQEGATKYPIQVYDYTAPTKGAVDLSQVQDGYQVTVTLTDWSDNVEITAFSFLVNNQEVEFEDLGDGVFRLNLTEENIGDLEITVTAFDEAENSTSELKPFTLVDNTAPVAGTFQLVQADDSQIVTATLIDWTDNSGVISGFTFFVGETEIAATKSSGGGFVYTMDLTEYGVGATAVTAVGADEAGNTASLEENIELVDNTKPVIGDVTFAQNGATFNVVAEMPGLADNIGVTELTFSINDNVIAYDDLGDGRYELQLGAEYMGENTVLIRAVDGAGNEATLEKALVLDNDKMDDWGDMGELGPEGTVGDIGVLSEETQYENAVGTDDPKDYMAFTLDSAANLIFTVQSANAIKFSINTLVAPTKQGGKFTLKSLQSASLKAGQTLDTKALLLDLENGEPTTYYIGVESADKNAKGAYSISTAKSTFFTNGDNSDDTYNGDGVAAFADPWEGWVGYGDTIDYSVLALENAASVSFDVSSSDAGKFTIWTLDAKTNKLKSVQSTATKLDKKVEGPQNNVATTKAQLLEAGTYYLSIENSNAKKGGSGDYTVVKNASYVVFDGGDNSDDTYNGDGVAAFDESWEGWVGYGDAIDYSVLALENAASVSFDVSSSDAGKFTIWTLDAKTNKLKSLQATATKLDKKVEGPQNNVATTKALLLQAGTYYLSIENTNAKKGGSGNYTVMMDDKTVFFTKGDNSDDWTDMKTKGAAGAVAKVTEPVMAGSTLVSDGWVGFGDSVDYMEITLAGATNNLQFDLTSTDAAKFTIYSLVAPAKAGAAYSLKSLQSTAVAANKNVTTKALKLAAGTYYIAMESTNAAKGGNADYTVKVNAATSISSMSLNEGDNEGTEKADAAIISANTAIGQLTMLAGNDQLLVGKDATLSFALIDMGEGNDVVNAGSGATLTALAENGIAFGAGDDAFVFNGAALNTSIDMGAGNDSVNFNLAADLADFDRSLELGAGDDAVAISGGNLSFASITFGAGNDALSIGEGCKLTVTGAFDANGLETLEMAEGATLVLNDEDSYNAASNKFAGMNIVNA